MALNSYGNNRGNIRRDDTRSREFEQVVQLPTEYTEEIKSGYYIKDKNGKKTIKKKLLLEYAEGCADAFKGGKPKMAYSQLRSFFDIVQNTALGLDSGVYTVDQAVSKMTELLPVAEYKRKNGLCPLCFKTFLEVNINNIKGSDDVRAFAKHFMCIACYMADDKNKNRR